MAFKRSAVRSRLSPLKVVNSTRIHDFFLYIWKPLVKRVVPKSLWRWEKIPVKIIDAVRQLHQQSKQGGTHMSMNDINRLSHMSWNCKYHIVFAPKYRRKVFYKEKRAMIGKILRQLCEWKGVKIIEAEACPDHIHLFTDAAPPASRQFRCCGEQNPMHNKRVGRSRLPRFLLP